MTESDILTISLTLLVSFSLVGFLIVCSVSSGTIMKRKGRSELTGNTLGLFLGPVGILICFCLPADEEKVAERLIKSGLKKRCNDCGSLIDADAKVCPFCSYAKAMIEQLRQVVKSRRL